jgi:phospholipid/cholesterol/gamma-HCH transport system permease protein
MAELTFNKAENKLIIGGFPQAAPRQDMIQEAFDACRSEAAKSPEVVFDLQGIKQTNFAAIALLTACCEWARENKKKLHFENTSGDLEAALSKAGWSTEGVEIAKRKPQKSRSIFLSIGEATYKICSDIKQIIGFVGDLTTILFKLLLHPRKIPFKEMLYYLERTGADAIPIVFMVCFLMGLILGYQGIDQMRRFGIELYVADLVGIAIVRELGPLMVGMICTGRAGSAFAAEIGTMKVNEEIDAIVTMGLPPARILVVPKMLALLIAMPLLTIIGDLAGVIGGCVICVGMGGFTVVEYFNRIQEVVFPMNLGESLIKSGIFAILVAGVGCLRGMEAENNAKGVGNATTSSVVSGIFLIVLADFFVTFTYPNVINLFFG